MTGRAARVRSDAVTCAFAWHGAGSDGCFSTSDTTPWSERLDRREGLTISLRCRQSPSPVHLVGADNAFTSCDLRILVEGAAEPVASPDADVVVGRRDISPAVGWLLAEGPVRPVGVVVIDVFGEDVAEMSSAGDKDAVGALAPRAGDPPLADRVHSRRLDRRADNPDAHSLEHRVECRSEAGVPVMQDELCPRPGVFQIHQEVPGLLYYPRLDRVLGGAEDPDPAGAVLDDGKDNKPSCRSAGRR